MKRLIILFTCLILSSSFVFAQAAPDRDGDGVPDASDRCPSEVGTRANDGCPATGGGSTRPEPTQQNNPDDRDGDGTNNSDDACPEAGGPDWNAGCPETTTDETEATPFPLSLPTEGDCVMAATTTVNRRDIPSVNGQVVGTMLAGELFPVLAILINVQENTSWYQTSPYSFVSTSVVALGGNCGGIATFTFSNPVTPLPFGIAFDFGQVDILMGQDETGTLHIAARPDEPDTTIDWLTSPEERPEPHPTLPTHFVAVIPDPVDPNRYLVAPDYDEPTPDPLPLVITLGPIVDPHPGLVLDISAPDFDTCTFTNFLGEANPAPSRSYLILQEKMGWDAFYVTYVQQPLFFWENILMTEAATVNVSGIAPEGKMNAILGNNDFVIQWVPDDQADVILPSAIQLHPDNFSNPGHYNVQVTVKHYEVPVMVNIGCSANN